MNTELTTVRVAIGGHTFSETTSGHVLVHTAGGTAAATIYPNSVARMLFDRVVELETPETGPVQMIQEPQPYLDLLDDWEPGSLDHARRAAALHMTRLYSLERNWAFVTLENKLRHMAGAPEHAKRPRFHVNQGGKVVASLEVGPLAKENALLIAQRLNENR